MSAFHSHVCIGLGQALKLSQNQRNICSSDSADRERLISLGSWYPQCMLWVSLQPGSMQSLSWSMGRLGGVVLTRRSGYDRESGRDDHADYDDDDDGTGRLRPTKKAHGGYELRQHVCFGCFVLFESPIPEDPK